MTSYLPLSFPADFLALPNNSHPLVLFVCASGYESRSLHLLSKIHDAGMLAHISVLALTFDEFRNVGSRPSNDAYLAGLGIAPVIIFNGLVETVILHIEESLRHLRGSEALVRVVIDYSSMPRQWYCALLRYFSAASWLDDVHFWYVQGGFGVQEYPCVGYGDFSVFSGQPRVTRTSEVHVFGLGFDSTRTYGIWNFLDPQYTCCLIGIADHNDDLVHRVCRVNSEILLAADVVKSVRMDDFPRLLASVVDLSRKCSSLGDVCLVADGPKPLVLAMSIAPEIFGKIGVSSWHVAHVKPDGYQPLDVLPTDHVFGFALRKTAHSNNL